MLEYPLQGKEQVLSPYISAHAERSAILSKPIGLGSSILRAWDHLDDQLPGWLSAAAFGWGPEQERALKRIPSGGQTGLLLGPHVLEDPLLLEVSTADKDVT